MKDQIAKFLHEEDGVTALEYGLIAGLIAVALITGLTLMSGALGALFTRITTALTTATAAP